MLAGEVTFTADGYEIVARPGDPPGRRQARRAPQVPRTRLRRGAPDDRGRPGATPTSRSSSPAPRPSRREGKYNRHGIPKSPGALLEAAEFADRYRDSTVLTGPAFPPPRLQPLLLGPLARLHRCAEARAAA